MTRPSDLDGPATLFDNVAATRLDKAFNEFHARNPQVYRTLAQLARDWRNGGHTRAGIGMLWEVMRWQLTMETEHKGSSFKLNNNLRSRYARLLMEQEPDLEDFFETRELRGT